MISEDISTANLDSIIQEDYIECIFRVMPVFSYTYQQKFKELIS